MAYVFVYAMYELSLFVHLSCVAFQYRGPRHKRFAGTRKAAPVVDSISRLR